MNRKFKLVFGTMCALLCGLYLSNAAFGQNLPDGKGKAEFIHNCTACHGADMATNTRKTPADWRKTVDDMAARGTDGTKQDIDNVYLYLSTNFALDKVDKLDKSAPTTAPSTAPPSNSGGRASIVSPQPMLDPRNNLIRLTRADGKTLNGRILSQDNHDTSGEVTTYSKPRLRKFTMINTNPMPSYEEKITGENSEGLVRYLGSLPSVDEGIQK